MIVEKWYERCKFEPLFSTTNGIVHLHVYLGHSREPKAETRILY